MLLDLCGLHFYSRDFICILVYLPIYFGSFMANHMVYREFYRELFTPLYPVMVSLISCTTHIHAYFYIFLLFSWYKTSTSEMALIGIVNYGTEYVPTTNGVIFVLQMTHMYIFTL